VGPGDGGHLQRERDGRSSSFDLEMNGFEMSEDAPPCGGDGTDPDNEKREGEMVRGWKSSFGDGERGGEGFRSRKGQGSDLEER